MIIGSGQIAQQFATTALTNTIFFASGVSDSGCTDRLQFQRETRLVSETLSANQGKTFVYFSSCALSASDYEKNLYYQHKQSIEQLIRAQTENYYIFRLPQVFGNILAHKTLINYLYAKISNGEPFIVYQDAYRYVLELDDLRDLVVAYLHHSAPAVTVNLANPYRYHILEIVGVIEELLQKKASYNLQKKSDEYMLDLAPMLEFIDANNLEFPFGEDYLFQKLKHKIA